MKCERCGAEIHPDEAMKAQGQEICEDCYIDLAAKPKTCDPWAVYSAKNLSPENAGMNENQRRIIEYMETHGPTPPARVARDLGLSLDDFEREMAPLRHMERIRARLEDGRKVVCLW
jgi:ribosome-binding protein aMBF1 (putative translation factor)